MAFIHKCTAAQGCPKTGNHFFVIQMITVSLFNLNQHSVVTLEEESLYCDL